MIIDEKTKRYIKEVYYYDYDYSDGGEGNIDEGIFDDIIRLLSGELSIEQLYQTIADAKMNDEKNYGDDIYKKEE